MTQLQPGDTISPRTLTAITGEDVTLPHPQGLTHLQFRRYAGCPFCNLHLRTITARHQEITSAGITEVVVFHSTAQDLLDYNEPTPFPIIADPTKVLYQEFGIEKSLRTIIDPRSWAPMIRGIKAKKDPLKADHSSGHLGLPADFLIDPTGGIIAVKYGEHAYDQWSVEDLLEHAAGSNL